jgi:hypothetical protein
MKLQLRNAGETVSDLALGNRLVAGLPSEYENLKIAIGTHKNLLRKISSMHCL